MTLFIILAALCLMAALAVYLPTVLGRGRGGTTDHLGINIAIARERREALDDAKARGAIDADTHAEEIARLEAELASDLDTVAADADGQIRGQRPGRSGTWITAAILLVALPLLAVGLYTRIGDPAAIEQAGAPRPTPPNATASGVDSIDDNAPDATNNQAPALAELLPGLEERLSQQPDDVDGWRLLGRSYLTVGEFEKASVALKRALALDDQDPDVLAQLGEASAMLQGGQLAGEPVIYIDRALALAPQHEQSLWLRGIAGQQSGDHDEALEFFDRLRSLVAARNESSALQTIDQMAERSRQALAQGTASPDPSSEPGESSSNESAPDDSAPNESAPDDSAPDAAAPAAGGVSIDVAIRLADAAAAAVSEEQSVFVYARAKEGPRMPLAVTRLRVADLPTEVRLDESMAMVPAMNLGAFDAVTVGARVSSSGDPMPAAGDWFGELSIDDTAGNPTVEIVIDSLRK